MVRNLIGLFQNSKTIRNVFSRRMGKKIEEVIQSSEMKTFETFSNFGSRKWHSSVWDCSSSHADLLRRNSWGQKVYGATVPHPIKLIKNISSQETPCIYCSVSTPPHLYISTLIPHGPVEYQNQRRK